MVAIVQACHLCRQLVPLPRSLEPAADFSATPLQAAGTSLKVVELDATQQSHPAKVAAELAQDGINHVDVLIANAGIAQAWPKISDVELVVRVADNVKADEDFSSRSAFLPLLNDSPNPKWVSIGSSAAMLTEMALRPMPNAAYGPTKVVLHWLTAKMHYEEPKLITLPLDPGWVQTDLGNFGAVALGYEKAETSIEDSVEGMMKIIDDATKETHSVDNQHKGTNSISNRPAALMQVAYLLTASLRLIRVSGHRDHDCHDRGKFEASMNDATIMEEKGLLNALGELHDS
nr:norsolorinic acid ketoreductase [Quercus suber]